MYYGEIKKCDIANGEGVRVSLFVSGCTHHCPGCFNADTWNFKYGSEYTDQTEKEILEALSPSYINGLTLLGGEPFEPENQKTLVGLLRKVRESYPEKNIWCYTGYTFEDVLEKMKKDNNIKDLIENIDVLVDGRFEKDKKVDGLKFKGSSNQRLIDVKKSLKSNCIIVLE